MDQLLTDYLEIPEVAKQLRVSRRTVQRMLEQRQIPFVYLGRRRIVPVSTFRAALKAREVKVGGRRK